MYKKLKIHNLFDKVNPDKGTICEKGKRIIF